MEKIGQTGTVDVFWLETSLLDLLRLLGCKMLGEILTDCSTRDIPADERFYQEHRHKRKRCLHTVMGKVEYYRDYYWNPEGSRVPFDREIGVEGHSCSPGLRKMMGYAASKASYKEASEDLWWLAGIKIPACEIQREVLQTGPALRDQQDALRKKIPVQDEIPVMYIEIDGTGTPMRPEVLKGRKGKQADGSARTREVKMGCVFTQTCLDEKGQPVRDPQSTSYVANYKAASDFGADILAEARHRGLGKAQRKVFLGDGALWIWELARVNFPDALQILDYYHASEHLHELATELGVASETLGEWSEKLWEGDVEAILKEANLAKSDCKDPEAAEGQIPYFEKNIERMRYAAFRKNGFFIGSGVVEGACKHVVGKRLKQSGMFWSLPGAGFVLDYRCAVLSKRYDSFWVGAFGIAA
mgnify:FL=1